MRKLLAQATRATKQAETRLQNRQSKLQKVKLRIRQFSSRFKRNLRQELPNLFMSGRVKQDAL
jgi:hypothetical protein